MTSLRNSWLRDFGVKEKVLVVTLQAEKNLYLSARNLDGVSVTHIGELNAYQILLSSRVLLATDALNLMKELWVK